MVAVRGLTPMVEERGLLTRRTLHVQTDCRKTTYRSIRSLIDYLCFACEVKASTTCRDQTLLESQMRFRSAAHLVAATVNQQNGRNADRFAKAGVAP